MFYHRFGERASMMFPDYLGGLRVEGPGIEEEKVNPTRTKTGTEGDF